MRGNVLVRVNTHILAQGSQPRPCPSQAQDAPDATGSVQQQVGRRSCGGREGIMTDPTSVSVRTPRPLRASSALLLALGCLGFDASATEPLILPAHGHGCAAIGAGPSRSGRGSSQSTTVWSFRLRNQGPAGARDRRLGLGSAGGTGHQPEREVQLQPRDHARLHCAANLCISSRLGCPRSGTRFHWRPGRTQRAWRVIESLRAYGEWVQFQIGPQLMNLVRVSFLSSRARPGAQRRTRYSSCGFRVAYV